MEALEATLKKRHELAQQRSKLTEQIEKIDEALNEYLSERGVVVEQAGPFTVRRITQQRKALDKQRLIELGVMPATINAATKTSEVKSLRVTLTAEDAPAAGNPHKAAA